MPTIKEHDQELMEMAIRAYDYVVSLHPTRRSQEEDTSIEKSFDFLENAFCELHLDSGVQTDGVKPRKVEV